MTKERLIDLFYMYGDDISHKMEQIASLEGYGNLEQTANIADIALIFNIPGGANKFRVMMENGHYFVIGNHELLLKLDAHIDYILDTVDSVNALEQVGATLDYNAIVAVVQSKTMALIEESIKFIKEW